MPYYNVSVSEVGNMKNIKRIILVLCLVLCTGCSGMDGGKTDFVMLEEEPAVALAAADSVKQSYETEASGVLVKKNGKCTIDYSNTEDGYVMVKYLKKTKKKIKAQVRGPKETYTYNVTPKEWEVFPLTDGNGTYQILLLENVSGSKYAVVGNLSCEVVLTDEFAPFLRSNQYVNFAEAPNTVKKAAALTKNAEDTLAKVEKIYNYVVTKFTYDKKKAKTVKSGYLPELDAVLEAKSGICFDYAAIMAGMLRSQEIPCKLVVGYAGEAYHAWISVYVEGEGWIEGVVYFDGTSWKRMDPTFASSGKQSQAIMEYIGNGKNYSAKYFY